MKIEYIPIGTAVIQGRALDWAVAKAEGIENCIHILSSNQSLILDHEIYAPSINWAQGGPLIELHCIEIIYSGSETMAKLYGELDAAASGPTPLMAVCRALIMHKIGHVVRVPSCLVNK